MVSKQEKERTIDYLCSKIEDSGHYVINQVSAPGNILLLEKPEMAPVNRLARKVSLLIGNFYSAEEFMKQVNQNRRNYTFETAPVLYKDGETAFARMVDYNLSWRTNKSLKNYSPQEINQMITLRKIEKMILKHWNKKAIVYYQPETARLEESIREFDLRTVILDYSHLNPEENKTRFSINEPSKDYKIPVDTEKRFPQLNFYFYNDGNDPSGRAWLESAHDPNEKKDSVISIIGRINPSSSDQDLLDRQEALKMLNDLELFLLRK